MNRGQMLFEKLQAETIPNNRKQFVRITHYGSTYNAYIVRVTGRNAVLRFRCATYHPNWDRKLGDGKLREVTYQSSPTGEMFKRAPTFLHQTVDRMTRLLTAFKSFSDMVDSNPSYRPTLAGSDFLEVTLANTYDEHMRLMGDSRRAFRGLR